MNTYSPALNNDMIRLLAEMYFEGRQIEVKELWMKTTTGKDLYFGNLMRAGKVNQ
jgi:23S rRNA (cytosine1962-C5)-methyltransferase